MSAYDKAALAAFLNQAQITLPPDAQDALEQYVQALLFKNEVMNLTAITDPYGVAVKHLADSLSLMGAPLSLPSSPKVADVGSGAGFPGIPLLVANPTWQGVLLDSLGKRVAFLNEMIALLGLSQRATATHQRAEEAGKDPALREQFDLVVARAVKALPTLLEYTLPLVKVGGYFVAWKGTDCAPELASAETALALLGGQLVSSHPVTLAPGEDRRLLLFQKVAQTPAKYPRPNKQIAAKPL